MDEYDENTPPLKHLLQNRTSDNINGRLCKNCHLKLQCHSIVKFQLCGKEMKRYSALVVSNNGIKQIICKPCNSTLVGELKCIACHKNYPKHRTIKFRVSKYNMNDDIIKATLQHPFIESESICIQCDRILIASNICTCCHGKFNLGRVTIFNPQNYNLKIILYPMH